MIQNTAEGQIDTGKMMTSLLKLCREKNITIFNGLKINDLYDSNITEGVSGGVKMVTEDGWDFQLKR